MKTVKMNGEEYVEVVKYWDKETNTYWYGSYEDWEKWIAKDN